MRKGYVIAIRGELKRPEELDAYRAKVGPTLNAVKRLASYGRQETREGPPSQGTAILEFESYEAAKAWYDSDMYGQARVHRANAADYQLIIVEGI